VLHDLNANHTYWVRRFAPFFVRAIFSRSLVSHWVLCRMSGCGGWHWQLKVVHDNQLASAQTKVDTEQCEELMTTLQTRQKDEFASLQRFRGLIQEIDKEISGMRLSLEKETATTQVWRAQVGIGVGAVPREFRKYTWGFRPVIVSHAGFYSTHANGLGRRLTQVG
jgi:hypothetical protein